MVVVAVVVVHSSSRSSGRSGCSRRSGIQAFEGGGSTQTRRENTNVCMEGVSVCKDCVFSASVCVWEVSETEWVVGKRGCVFQACHSHV